MTPGPVDLSVRDLDGVLKVLEGCEHAASLREFRERTLEGIGRHLGHRDTTFFVGSGLEELFGDESAVGNGNAARLIPEYLDRHQSSDVFRYPHALKLLRARRAATLEQVCRRGRPNHYLDGFLFRHGIHAKTVITLPTPSGTTGAIGLLHPSAAAFGPRTMAVATLLSRHLANLLTWHVSPAASPTEHVLPGLSPRQAEVTALVARGLTNQQIARTLHIGVDTVKKHLTAALAVTGCANRTRLALAWTTAARRSRPS